MEIKFLFPYKFKRAGSILVGISLIMAIFFALAGESQLLKSVPVFYFYDSGIPIFGSSTKNQFMSFKYDDIRFELITTLFVIGCLFIGFSRLRTEDEYTMRLRLESLLWAMYINFTIFIISVLFIYGIDFMSIPFYSLLAFLVIFNLRFYYVLDQAKKSTSYEK